MQLLLRRWTSSTPCLLPPCDALLAVAKFSGGLCPSVRLAPSGTGAEGLSGGCGCCGMLLWLGSGCGPAAMTVVGVPLLSRSVPSQWVSVVQGGGIAGGAG